MTCKIFIRQNRKMRSWHIEHRFSHSEFSLLPWQMPVRPMHWKQGDRLDVIRRWDMCLYHRETDYFQLTVCFSWVYLQHFIRLEVTKWHKTLQTKHKTGRRRWGTVTGGHFLPKTKVVASNSHNGCAWLGEGYTATLATWHQDCKVAPWHRK